MDLRDIGFLEPLVSEYLYEMAGGLDGVVDYKQGRRAYQLTRSPALPAGQRGRRRDRCHVHLG